MKIFKHSLSIILTAIMLLSSLSVNMSVNADETDDVSVDEISVTERAAQREGAEVDDTELAEAPSTVTERGMQFKIENLESVKSIRYAYGEYETEKDIKYGTDSVSHSGKTLRNRGDSCTLQFTKPGLVSIVVTYNDGTRDFYKYDVIKSEPTVTRDGGNSITFGNLDDLKVLRYVKGEYETSYDIKRAENSVAISGKTLDSDTYTVNLDRETYTFCVQYNDESYNYYVTGVCGDNLTWVYDMQSATLTVSGEGEMDYYKTIPWVGYLAKIKTVIFEPGITSIDSYSFDDAVSLTEVCFPNTLENIGIFCFKGCTSLKSIEIPDSVTVIGARAFKGCSSLKSVVIDKIDYISSGLFEDCTALTEVKISNDIQKIRTNAFSGCSSLYNIELPKPDIYIQEGAFDRTGIAADPRNWEDGLLYLDTYLINSKYGYGEVDTIVIRDGTIAIAECALIDVRANYVYIPKSVTVIYDGGIPLNSDRTLMVYENSYAHRYAIENGYKYELIPANTVEGVCGDNLTWVYNLDTSTLTISGDGEMYDYGSKGIPWNDYKSEIVNLILNEGITVISPYAFSLITKITEVNLPSTLKTIGRGSFYNCKSLETLVIPNNVEEIGQTAFNECFNLQSVIIGNGIKTIDMFTFARCTSLTNITFPESLEKICSQAFSGCSSLENIQLPDIPINIESDSFIGTAFFTNPDNWENGTLYLDNFLITGTCYTQVPFTVKNGTKYIGSYALVEVYELQTVTIPQSVVFIGEYAISKDVIILCYENSYAHRYAMENGYSYSFIE